MIYIVGLPVVIWGRTKLLTGYERDFTGLVILRTYTSGANNALSV